MPIFFVEVPENDRCAQNKHETVHARMDVNLRCLFTVHFLEVSQVSNKVRIRAKSPNIIMLLLFPYMLYFEFVVH